VPLDSSPSYMALLFFATTARSGSSASRPSIRSGSP
jgi:hypothetical protein